jgi:hypothetical protein
MSILDKLKEFKWHEQRPLRNRLYALELNESSMATPGDGKSFGTSRRYTLSLTVWSEFYANSAQYAIARKHSERVLLGTLYGEILSKVDGCASAIASGDDQPAFSLLNEIRTELTQ